MAETPMYSKWIDGSTDIDLCMLTAHHLMLVGLICQPPAPSRPWAEDVGWGRGRRGGSRRVRCRVRWTVCRVDWCCPTRPLHWH